MNFSEAPEGSPGAEEARRARNIEEALFGLYSAGHYEQVLGQGRRLLEREPENSFAHYFLALTLVQIKRPKDAFPHIDYLLGSEPNWGPTHHAACLGFKELRRYNDAWAHIQTALQLEPTEASYHTVAAVLSLHRNELQQARDSVATARRLDPQNANIARLDIEIRGIHQSSARESWERIRELEQALSLDPNNPGLHASIGYIHLDELDRAQEAEQCFREALGRDPSERQHQKALFRAVGLQRMFYRLLSIPIRTYARLRDWLQGMSAQPWRILFLLLAFKVVMVFVLWLVLVTLVFWPAAKLYQWLLISEIECAAESTERQLRFKRALNRWPFWARFSVCAGLILGFWLSLFAALGVAATGFLILASFIGIHFVVTLVMFALGKARSEYGRWDADRRATRKPPPLPR